MKIDKAEIEDYGIYLKDKYRPPSRNGNKRALHQHVFIIAGEKYTFLAPWRGKFVFKRETVSFDWDWDATGKHRNIACESVVAWGTDGIPVIRGERGYKPPRLAETRLPARRSDWKD